MYGILGDTFGGTFPYAPRYLDVNGFPMHFVDEGEGDPIVMLHGDPTWGYLFRKFIPPLSLKGRCVVPDHMGMGKSAAPQWLYPYRLRHHVSNLENLLLSLDLHAITLVVHDWGGPVGLGFAVRHSTRIKRLVLLNTWAFAKWPSGPLPRLLQIIRSEKGEKFILEKNVYIKSALLRSVCRPENLTRNVMDAYLAPFPTPESRLALLSWTRDISLDEKDPSYRDMAEIEAGLFRFRRTPVLLLWGMQDPVLSEPVLRMWQRVFPQAVTHTFEDAGHFLPEDAPVRTVLQIEDFLNS